MHSLIPRSAYGTDQRNHHAKNRSDGASKRVGSIRDRFLDEGELYQRISSFNLARDSTSAKWSEAYVQASRISWLA